MKLHNITLKITQYISLKKIIAGLVGILVAVVVFQAGVFVGFHKASFDRSWNNHYLENFGPRHKSPLGAMPEQFTGGHGTIGKIVSVSLSTIVVADRSNVEKIITVSNETKIRRFQDEVGFENLIPGTLVVVLGSPNNQGQIDAKLIRIFPSSSNSFKQ